MAANPPSARRAFADHVVDLLGGLGRVQAKPMFGGHGLYLDGVMFALLSNARFFVKVDEVSCAVFDAARCMPFTVTSKGRQVTLSYREAPPEALDQPQVAEHWGRLGLAAAHRAASKGAAAAPTGLSGLRNLGSRSLQMLASAGIHTEAQLRCLGAVRAYVRVKARCGGASLNLLWALEGALTDRHWQAVAQSDRASLLMALEDALHAVPPDGHSG